MDTIDSILSYLDKLQGLSGVALVFLSCIVVGYAWRFIHLKWFSNDAIPLFVILWGAFAQSLLADARVSTMPFRVWFLRNVIVGAVIGFSAWLAHSLIISKIEDWLAEKVPAIASLLNGKVKPPPVPLALLAGLLALATAGCASFSTQVFRVEQSSTAVAMTAYQGWTNYLAHFPVTPQASNDVKQARLRFAATVSTVEALRSSYATNALVRPQIEAGLVSISDQASNIVWLISFLKGK